MRAPVWLRKGRRSLWTAENRRAWQKAELAEVMGMGKVRQEAELELVEVKRMGKARQEAEPVRKARQEAELVEAEQMRKARQEAEPGLAEAE